MQKNYYKMDKFSKIRAYRCGWLLQLIDWPIVFPGIYLNMHRTTSSVRVKGAEHVRQRFWPFPKHPGHLFLTNHRDIVLDAAYMSVMLRQEKNIRPFMGIGNNLFGKWWIEPVVRLMRCFVVIRDSKGLHEQKANSQLLSEYIREQIEHGRSVWLAQREGRAKDGNDRTQPSVIKMLTMSGESKDLLQKVRELNICPVSINYEYDPCDYLKAQEMQLKRDDATWKKTKQDDILSMATGIKGQKGRVVYHFTPSINGWIDANEEELRTMNRNQQIDAICRQIDHQIHANYEDYDRTSSEFEAYLKSRLALINIPNKDEAFLMDKLHEMYNNPVINKQAALQ